MPLAAAEDFIGPVWQQALNRLLTELGITGDDDEAYARADADADAAGDLPAPQVFTAAQAAQKLSMASA